MYYATMLIRRRNLRNWINWRTYVGEALNPLGFVRAELDVQGSILYDHRQDFAR